jgi:hypothetical protein
MQASEPATSADDHLRREPFDRVGDTGLLRRADGARGNALRRLGPRTEVFDVKLVQGFAAQEPNLAAGRGIVRGGGRKVKGRPRRDA